MAVIPKIKTLRIKKTIFEIIFYQIWIYLILKLYVLGDSEKKLFDNWQEGQEHKTQERQEHNNVGTWHRKSKTDLANTE